MLGQIRRAALALLLSLVACSSKEAPPGPPPAPVRVATAERASVPVRLRAIGTVEPSSTVSLKPRVSGQISEVLFEEGQDVAEGDALFQLDRRPFEVALREAEAELTRSRVQAENAHAEAERYRTLVEAGVASREQAAERRTNAGALAAAVQAGQATVAARRLDLTYTTIRAPIAGRTGAVLAREGNLVQANETTLVVINRLRPIFVSFTIPEQDLPELQHYLAQGQVPVTAAPADAPDAGERGILTFIDNEVDRATGTVRVKGTFENRDLKLWPGRFVEVVVTLTTREDALVIPAAAVQVGQEGAYVFVVGPDATAEMRLIEQGARVDGERVVVERGLAAGERVVTDGQLRLTPGAKVSVVGEPA